MTLLPLTLQWNYPIAITQFKGQECPSTSKKRTKSKNWHENQDITHVQSTCAQIQSANGKWSNPQLPQSKIMKGNHHSILIKIHFVKILVHKLTLFTLDF